MRYPSLTIAIALLATACDEAAEPEPAAQPEQAPEATAADAVQKLPRPLSLEGEWQVASIDGETVDLSTPLTLSVGEQIMDWGPGCAQLAHRYTISEEAVVSAPRIRQFVTDAARDQSRAALHPPPCAIGLPEGLADAMTAVESATKIERTTQNGIRLSGHDRSITLLPE